MRNYQIGYSYKNRKFNAVVELEMITEDNIIRELMKTNKDLVTNWDRKSFIIESVIVA